MGIAQEPQIESPLAQWHNLFASVGLAGQNMHIRVALTKHRQRIGYRLDKGGRGGKADTQFAGFTVMQTRSAGGRVIHLGKNLSAIGEKLLSGRRQTDAAIGAREQAGTGLLLEDLNLLA